MEVNRLRQPRFDCIAEVFLLLSSQSLPSLGLATPMVRHSPGAGGASVTSKSILGRSRRTGVRRSKRFGLVSASERDKESLCRGQLLLILAGSREALLSFYAAGLLLHLGPRALAPKPRCNSLLCFSKVIYPHAAQPEKALL